MSRQSLSQKPSMSVNQSVNSAMQSLNSSAINQTDRNSTKKTPSPSPWNKLSALNAFNLKKQTLKSTITNNQASAHIKKT
jgi:hypothetical protein